MLTPRILILALSVCWLPVSSLQAREPLGSRIAHTTPGQFHHSPKVHDGAGSMDFMAFFSPQDFNTNLFFLHRGVIQPKSGIGAHFHNQCEEMFVIFDGEAQFTIDGRTSLLKAPAGALCRQGHSHAIYNPTDKPLQWMNINIGSERSRYDAFNLGDSRVGAPLDAIPTFMTMHLDKRLLKPAGGDPGGKNSISYRRVLTPDVFSTNWSYVDQALIAPGSSSPKEKHEGVEEFYYVMSGSGVAHINGESAPVQAGDAVPVLFNDVHDFENTGSSDLELMVVGIARVKYALDTQRIP